MLKPRVSILAVAAIPVLVILTAGGASAQNPRWGANYFPNVTLTTHEGQHVRFYDDLLKGRIVAIDLIYTTCKYACPLQTARLAQVQRLLGDRMGHDVFFYSITIDPEHDTPAVLKEYAQKYNAGPGWLFLTGSAGDIELISKKLGLYSEPDPSRADGHTSSLLVGNELTGQWMRNSALDNPRFLATTIGSWMGGWKDASAARSYAEATPLTLDRGAYAYNKHCAPCHTIGAGPRVGPDLAGVTKSRERGWLARFIASPQQLRAENDATAVALFEKFKPVQMPTLGLPADEVAAIIGYMMRQESASASPSAGRSPAAPSPAAAVGSAVAAVVRARETPAERIDIRPALGEYLRIQQALSQDTLSGVGDAARAIAANLASSSAEPIRSAALELADTKDLARARTAFGTLGNAMMAAAKASQATLADGVRVAYCPMAKKYWLQKGEEIRNPFYGKEMLDCGRLVAEIPDGLR